MAPLKSHRVGASKRLRLLVVFFSLLALAGCRRDMQDQPKSKPYRASSFFKDGLSSRQPVAGTIARGWLREDRELYTGKKNVSTAAPITTSQSGPVVATPNANANPSQVAAAYPDDVENFPFPITPEILERGQERFQIYCSVCHGMTGQGDGMIVRRGFRKPPSYSEQRLREAPVGHFFDVVTNGWGAMPSYASQVPVRDRWAIIAYIRALQLSQAGAQPPTENAGEKK